MCRSVRGRLLPGLHHRCLPGLSPLRFAELGWFWGEAINSMTSARASPPGVGRALVQSSGYKGVMQRAVRHSHRSHFSALRLPARPRPGPWPPRLDPAGELCRRRGGLGSGVFWYRLCSPSFSLQLIVPRALLLLRAGKSFSPRTNFLFRAAARTAPSGRERRAGLPGPRRSSRRALGRQRSPTPSRALGDGRQS